MDSIETGSASTDTTTERVSDTELVVKRLFDGPPHLVYKAWTTPELLLKWWTPKSFGITFISCEADVRTGGSYRFVFGHPDFDQPMPFYGKYLEVRPNELLKWTNAEGGENGSVTTVTFTAQGDKTLLVLRDVYPNKAALDAEMESGAVGGYPEQFKGLDGLLAAGEI